MAYSRLVSRTFASTQGRTTMRLEPEFWDMFREIAKREGISMAALVRNVDAIRGDFCRTSACRVYILQYFCKVAVQSHQAANDRAHLPKCLEVCQIGLEAPAQPAGE